MRFAMLCVAAFLAAGTCFAQNDDKAPDRYFRLDYVVKELEAGKVISARSYFTTVTNQNNRENSSIRTGDKIPIPTGTGGSYTYIDVGVNIDSRFVRATDTHLMLIVSADISSFLPATNPAPNMPAPLPPVVRQNKWSANVTVPLKKPTTILSADGASEKRQMQIELTATPIL